MKIICIIFCLFLLTMCSASARRGCCSHHAGVCGCGRFDGCVWFPNKQLRCDGTLSKSCYCGQ